jgi:hypothetical protein
METIYNVDSLEKKIQELEIRQDTEWCAIKDEIDEIKDNLKPLNLIRNTVEEINDTVGFKGNLAQSAVSIGIGYLTKKIIVGRSNSTFKNIFGSLLQLVVTNLVSKKPHETSHEESY